MKEDDQQASSGSPAPGDSPPTAQEAERVPSIMPHDPSSTAGRDAFGEVTDFGVQEDVDDPEQDSGSV